MKPELQERLNRIKGFLRRDLWEKDVEEISLRSRLLVRPAQVAVLVIRDFFADNCLLRASALTYVTLLSIIPLLALAFSILKGLGVQDMLEPVILEQIAVGSEEIVDQIVAYINNTNVTSLGAIGLVFLVITVLALLTNIEASFNYVWRVEETRTLFRRFADYFSIITVGPIFLLAAISMTTTLESQRFVVELLKYPVVGDLVLFAFKVLPFLTMWIAFTALYIFMPNTRVSYRAALAGGIFGGTLWQLAQWAYVTFQFGVSRYNAIYGTMAALPIFMVWIYLSWLIVLLGLEVTYAVQNLKTIRRELYGEKVNFVSREKVALTILLKVVDAFGRGERPRTMEGISEELDLPPRLTRTVVDELVRLRLLSPVHEGHGDEFAYQPGRAPEKVRVAEVIGALREDGISLERPGRTPEWRLVAEIEEQMGGAWHQALGETTLRDLAGRIGEAGEAGPSEDQ